MKVYVYVHVDVCRHVDTCNYLEIIENHTEEDGTCTCPCQCFKQMLKLS